MNFIQTFKYVFTSIFSAFFFLKKNAIEESTLMSTETRLFLSNRANRKELQKKIDDLKKNSHPESVS